MEQLQNLRKQLDGLAKAAGLLMTVEAFDVTTDTTNILNKTNHFEVGGVYTAKGSKHTEACQDALFYAKAWTGNLLGCLGNQTPYKNDGQRKEVKDIEPTDSTVDIKAWAEKVGWSKMNPVQQIDFLREKIKLKVEEIETIELPKEIKKPREAAICRTNIYNLLCGARFALGFELQRIKEESEAEGSINLGRTTDEGRRTGH